MKQLKEDGNMEFVMEDGKSDQRLSFVLLASSHETVELK